MKNLFYLLFTLSLLFSCEDASTDDFVSDKNKDSDSEKPLTCDEIDGLQITNLDEVPNDYTGAAILCEDGKMLDLSNYVDGTTEGSHKTWYENGQLHSESNYKNGAVDGLMKVWSENGQLIYEGYYKKGIRQ